MWVANEFCFQTEFIINYYAIQQFIEGEAPLYWLCDQIYYKNYNSRVFGAMNLEQRFNST